MMNLPENVHINLSPDTSFYLSKEDFNVLKGNYDLICFRTDMESRIFPRSRPNTIANEGIIELTCLDRRIVVGDISLLNSFRKFVNLIEGSENIFTDRLHVAILSAILEKKTVLFPNSYYKNRGVYEFSLYKYPGVKFVNNPKYLKTLGYIMVSLGHSKSLKAYEALYKVLVKCIKYEEDPYNGWKKD
ncbi:MAG: polysaccharide pyruvyl transferase family protein [Candidatus Aenigmatarchaeota archaeon]